MGVSSNHDDDESGHGQFMHSFHTNVCVLNLPVTFHMVLHAVSMTSSQMLRL